MLTKRLLAGQGGITEVSHTDSGMDTGNKASYSFSSLSLGAANDNRYIIVAVHVTYATGDGVPTAVTVAGNSCTKIKQATFVGDYGATYHVSLWRVALTTGTTGTVAVTLPGGNTNYGCGVGVWRLIHEDGTLYDSAANAGDVGGSLSVDTPSGGALVAASIEEDGNQSTWTGANEDYDSVYNDYNSQRASGAHVDGTDGDTGVTVDASNGQAQVCCVWE